MLAGVAAVGMITLTPASPGPRLPVWCLTCGDRPAVDALLNVLLFLPLAVGMGLSRVGFRRALLFGALGSILIESLQATVVAGRFPSGRDVLANSLGAAVGYLIGSGLTTLVRPQPRAARSLALGAAAAWLVTQAFTAWAMGIAAPPTPWWAQLRPEYDEYPAVFAGTVVRASIGSLPIDESDEISRGDEARRELLNGAPVSAVLTGVRPTIARALVMVITAGPVYEAAYWEQEGTDAVFTVPVRGTFAGLRTPSVRLAGAMRANARDTVTLRGIYAHGRYHLTAVHGRAVVVRDLAASPSFLWAFLLPIPMYAFGSEVHAVTALWIACIWLLFGYWGARAIGSARRAQIFAASAATLCLGLAMAPVLFGVPPSHWSEWVAGVGGFAGGWAFARFVLARE